mmetsp:Transcript_66626/g.214693  ORF Transcript_66626/g.214693 Transcript_66626/m.214693 type:complete len:257 (-) Transcript_66626:562-1332(-)
MTALPCSAAPRGLRAHARTGCASGFCCHACTCLAPARAAAAVLALDAAFAARVFARRSAFPVGVLGMEVAATVPAAMSAPLTAAAPEGSCMTATFKSAVRAGAAAAQQMAESIGVPVGGPAASSAASSVALVSALTELSVASKVLPASAHGRTPVMSDCVRANSPVLRGLLPPAPAPACTACPALSSLGQLMRRPGALAELLNIWWPLGATEMNVLATTTSHPVLSADAQGNRGSGGAFQESRGHRKPPRVCCETP